MRHDVDWVQRTHDALEHLHENIEQPIIFRGYDTKDKMWREFVLSPSPTMSPMMASSGALPLSTTSLPLSTTSLPLSTTLLRQVLLLSWVQNLNRLGFHVSYLFNKSKSIDNA